MMPDIILQQGYKPHIMKDGRQALGPYKTFNKNFGMHKVIDHPLRLHRGMDKRTLEGVRREREKYPNGYNKARENARRG